MVLFFLFFWQLTNVFLDGHSNPYVQIVGLKMSSVLEDVQVPHYEVEGPLRYSLVSSPI
jgi:DNA repair protein RAD7